MYVELNHFSVHLKHYKSTIFQLKMIEITYFCENKKWHNSKANKITIGVFPSSELLKIEV